MLKICKNFEKTPWEARLKENFESDPFYKLAKQNLEEFYEKKGW